MTVFRTARLDIREWTDAPADLARIYDTYRQWEVARWLGATPRAMAEPAEAGRAVGRWREQYAQWAGRYGAWAIEDRVTGVVAGSVLLKPLPNADGTPPRDIEVGWHLHPDSWGHGYATEAARGALDFAFRHRVPEVFAVVYPENTRSMAVCRRLGMTPLGRTDRWYPVLVEAFVSHPPAGSGGAAPD